MAEISSQPGGSGTERTPPGPTQSNDRTKPNFEPDDDEKTVVGQWLKRVDRAQDEEKTKAWREGLKKLRMYERGEQKVDDQKSRTNMVYATLAAQMPKLYAKNPTIAVSPTDAVAEAEIQKVKKFCGTADRVVRKMLVEEGKLKKRAKANIRSTSVTSYGALKMTYQTEYRGDAIAVRRIEDAQDNLARVEALVKQLKATDDPSELAKKRDELRANLEALKAKNEVGQYKGFAVDRIKSEDFLMLDDSIAEFDEYVDARALGHLIWMTVGHARELFKMEPKGATRYGQPRLNDARVDDTPADDQFICVAEIWDKENGVVRTTAKGMNRWLREPYAPAHAPQRWYPFYLLGFNITEGGWRPLSDVEMLTHLQEEYDRTRQNYADVREKTVPVLIFRKAGSLSEDDVKNVTNRKNKDTIGVEGNPSQPLTQDLMWFQGAKIDPQSYDVTLIRNDMDIVSGSSDAGRANLIQPKTATEAEIMAEAMESRLSERRDMNEDLLSEMGEAALEIALQDLSLEEVRQIAGADAEWPNTPQGAEQVFRQVQVKVRAGSSGKPNQQREREQWGQLMPVIEKTMTAVADLRAQGNFDMAEAMLELLRETLRRYDEHLDLDALIPPMEKDENGKPVAQQQAAAALVQTQQQLQECQQALEQCQGELQKAQQGDQAKAAEITAQAQLAQQEQDQAAKVAADQAARDAVEKAAKTARDHELALEKERTKQAEIAAAEERHKRELASKEAIAAADREARGKEKDGEREHQAALKRIESGLPATQAEMAAAAEAREAEKQAAAQREAAFVATMGKLAQTMDRMVVALEKPHQEGAREITFDLDDNGLPVSAKSVPVKPH